MIRIPITRRISWPGRGSEAWDAVTGGLYEAGMYVMVVVIFTGAALVPAVLFPATTAETVETANLTPARQNSI
ncbi:MAG TPA: hypothetical protein VMS89_05245 [Methanoregulaceae archaeon]|nr:hypothetical protein [Methanoregulaceae archaeon]